jgi:hypothetical protein
MSGRHILATQKIYKKNIKFCTIKGADNYRWNWFQPSPPVDNVGQTWNYHTERKKTNRKGKGYRGGGGQLQIQRQKKYGLVKFFLF